MSDTPLWFLLVLAALAAAVIGLAVALARASRARDDGPVAQQAADLVVARLLPLQESLERQLRDEVQRTAQGQRADA
ncbi:MAG: hypothetical protein EBQ88_00345, partial [Betaproteobacteria bacterium]|nr:hypothetical protein [Betaproteobacteria bacterium]